MKSAVYKWQAASRWLAVMLLMWGAGSGAIAGEISQLPLFLTQEVPPLNLIVLGRDHKLYYEAYNDASDLNGDGKLDIRYDPAIEYFGYFDSHKCYEYNGSASPPRFEPSSVSVDKTCSGTLEWSGDYLNYLTTARIDALRKVLYGGYRVVDATDRTVLERSHVPQDGHSWGKEYSSVTVDGYDIRDYTPLSLPFSGRRHLFGNTTMRLDDSIPRLKVATNSGKRIWQWASKESPVLDSSVLSTDYAVRVEVCKNGMLESNCRQYTDEGGTDHYKPAGLLQEYGEDDRMLFGLLTGSYAKNTSGGVLRKKIESFSNEVNSETGQFTSVNGIVKTIDKLKTVGFSTGHTYNENCSWIATRAIKEGECRMWGNPIAEMMYEGLRYFSGKGAPTPDFQISSTGNDDAKLGLPLATWEDPFAEGNNEYCAKPFQLVISDINPSYDTDQLPGSFFQSFLGALAALDVEAIGKDIWAHEHSSALDVFIGQSGTTYDGAPTPKSTDSFGTIRGLSPEEPTKRGGYYAASISLFANQNDISGARSDQNMTTFAVALASPLPQIKIPVGTGTVTLIPFAKSVGGYSISPLQGDFQPTNTIVDFYVETLTPTSGKFRINFEDVEQGADHDMDAIAEYTYQVLDDNTLKIDIASTYASGSIIQHLGYVISGTTADGTYLEVRDADTAVGSDPDYFLDTPPGQPIGFGWYDKDALPLSASRTFKVSSQNAAAFLKNPLWYAAKYGNFKDLNGNGLPDDGEWDADGDGVPDNYFLVTNALTLNDQLSQAFSTILGMSSSAAAIATNSTRLDTDTLIYQARFDSGDWSGQLLAYPVNDDGSVGLPVWDAAKLLPTPASRNIFTLNPDVSGSPKGVPFTWNVSTSLHATQQAALNRNGAGAVDGLGKERLNYLRGVQSGEQKNGGSFRDRKGVLGDIINSDPWFVGTQNYGYADLSDLEGTSYVSFRNSAAYASRTKMLYVGGNDGMLHAFDAETGVEKFSYVPLGAFAGLSALTDPTYEHQMYVDGSPRATDAYIDVSGDGNPEWRTVLAGTLGAGGKTVFALDVTEPDSFDGDDVLWEYADTDLGYTVGQAYVVRMANGKWAAVFGNGYNSTNYRAVLYIVDLQTGALIKKIDTGVGGAATPNGLATPAPVDYDGDRVVDAIYAGDLLGNLWKFDVADKTTGNWSIALKKGSTPIPLFKAKGPAGETQPITSRPNVGYGPAGSSSEVMVYFGTGKYFEKFDNVVGASPPVQTFYGIRDSRDSDSAITVTDRSVLVEQSILAEVNAFDYNLRVISDHEVIYGKTVKGWYMDLISPISGADGERVVDSPLLIGDHLIFTSIVPSGNPCDFGGTGWLYEMDPLTGGRVTYSVFDLDGDGLFDESDYVTVEIDGKEVKVPVSGKQSSSGIITTPGVISAGTKEYKLSSTSSGDVETTTEKPGEGNRLGRSSWRQIR